MNIGRAVALSLMLAFSWSASAGAGSRTAPIAAQLVASHNLERREVGAPPIEWDNGLAAAADSYAAELARTDRWGHAPADQRVGQGENLWMGTRGAFSLANMMADWVVEKRQFRAGVFPNITRSSSWHDVGHYTQIVWPETTRVGCSIRSSAEWDYLVCRYSSPGNVMGGRVGAPQVAAR